MACGAESSCKGQGSELRGSDVMGGESVIDVSTGSTGSTPVACNVVGGIGSDVGCIDLVTLLGLCVKEERLRLSCTFVRDGDGLVYLASPGSESIISTSSRIFSRA